MRPILQIVVVTAVLALSENAAAIDVAMARDILFAADNTMPPADVCASGDGVAQIGCLIDLRYAADKRAAKIARELHARTGSVSGILPEQDFDGEYRGMLHFVPHLP